MPANRMVEVLVAERGAAKLPFTRVHNGSYCHNNQLVIIHLCSWLTMTFHILIYLVLYLETYQKR
jgi:hypothetical protein